MMGSIGDIYSGYLSQTDVSNVNASALSSKLKQTNASEATDEELLDACKEFESYLIEQVMKQVQDSIPKSDEEKDNKYLDYFGDMMLQEYASVLTEQGDLGIAQKLYESMKNNTRTVNIKSVSEEKPTEETLSGAKQTEAVE